MHHKIKTQNISVFDEVEFILKQNNFPVHVRNRKRLYLSTNYLPIHLVAQLKNIGAIISIDAQYDPE